MTPSSSRPPPNRRRPPAAARAAASLGRHRRRHLARLARPHAQPRAAARGIRCRRRRSAREARRRGVMPIRGPVATVDLAPVRRGRAARMGALRAAPGSSPARSRAPRSACLAPSTARAPARGRGAGASPRSPNAAPAPGSAPRRPCPRARQTKLSRSGCRRRGTRRRARAARTGARFAAVRPDVRVAGGIVALVALALHDHPADAVEQQRAADQVARRRRAPSDRRSSASSRTRGEQSASSSPDLLEGCAGGLRAARRAAPTRCRPPSASTPAIAPGAAPRSRSRRAGRSGGRAPPGSARTGALPCSSASRTSSPTTPWASRNGIPLRTRRSATSVAAANSSAAASASRSRSKLRPTEHALGRLEAELEGVDGVEERLLVLLEVLRVGERQPVHDPGEGQEAGGDPRRLGSQQLGRVGVLLLRHDARARGEVLGQLAEGELVARPEHDLGAEAGEVHGADRGRGEVVENEVAVGDRVDRVGRDRVEAQVARRRRRDRGPS